MSGKLQRTLIGLVFSTSEKVPVIQLQHEPHYGDKKLTYKPNPRAQQFENFNYVLNIRDTRRKEQPLKDTCCTCPPPPPHPPPPPQLQKYLRSMRDNVLHCKDQRIEQRVTGCKKRWEVHVISLYFHYVTHLLGPVRAALNSVF